jgi:hypothetical protein
VNVTTGGISIAVGTLIVGTLGIAALMIVREENEGPAGCEPQSFDVAREEVEQVDDATVVPVADVRDLVAKGYPLPDWSGDGFVIVALDRARKGVTPPACLDRTPIVYVRTKRVTG